MAQPERYFIGPTVREKLTEVFARVGGMPAGSGGKTPATSLQDIQRPQKRSRYFRTNEELPVCSSAMGTEVEISSPDCIQVQDIEGAEPVELFDVSNSVRVFNLVKQRGIDLALPVGSIIEAMEEPQLSSGDPFWRILQVLSCDCGSSSSSSASSSGSSSSSSASSSGSSSSSSASSSGSSRSSESSSAPSSSSGSSSSGGSSSDSVSSSSGGSGSASGSQDPCATVEPSALESASLDSLYSAAASPPGSSGSSGASVALFGFSDTGDLIRVEISDLAAAISGSAGSV